MKSGCFLTLLLLPILIIIWIEKERRRRAVMPPDELKAQDAEINFGPFQPDFKCPFCKKTGCVRLKEEEYYVYGGPAVNSTEGIKFILSMLGAGRGAAAAVNTEMRCFAHCMNCGNYWEIFPSGRKER